MELKERGKAIDGESFSSENQESTSLGLELNLKLADLNSSSGIHKTSTKWTHKANTKLVDEESSSACSQKMEDFGGSRQWEPYRETERTREEQKVSPKFASRESFLLHKFLDSNEALVKGLGPVAASKRRSKGSS